MSIQIDRSANSKLPQRDPFIGPPATYSGVSAEVAERFADAVREWADRPVPTQSPRCRVSSPPASGAPPTRRGCDAPRSFADTRHKLALAPVDSAPIYQCASDGWLSSVDEDGWICDSDADLDKGDAITVTPISVCDTGMS